MLTQQITSVKIESMNIGPVPDRVRRAAVHAALADPGRLAITDALLLGDASPSELAALLAMPSNLLAHHLRTLEQAGVITRHRSEGDRRRAYLRLIPGSLGRHPARRADRSRRDRRRPPSPPAAAPAPPPPHQRGPAR
jgi:ArsR family transcriptional regulator, arsenate/arsenite/antimonite-responsive transcriptional repressor / arsenate reductase (thioredoxin)